MTMAQEAEEITLHHKTTATPLPWPYHFLSKGLFHGCITLTFNFLFVGKKRGIHDFFPPPVVLIDFNFINIDVRIPNVRIMLALMTLETYLPIFVDNLLFLNT